jgi:nicotinamide riboside kinase
VRAGLTQRVVVLGAESTGTTTLSKALARRLSAPWIREYGRDLSESRAHQAGSIEAVRWTSADFDHVADQQEALEQIAIRAWVDDAETSRPGELGPLAVCDTDVLATAIWHRRYCGTPAPHLVERALTRPPLVYILTSPDGVAFEQDGLRDGEALRGPMTGWFRDALEDQPTPWTEVTGTELAREEAALAAIRLAVASSGPRFRTR